MIDDKKIEEAFKEYVNGSDPMYDFEPFKAGYLAAMEEMKNKRIGFCDWCDEFADLGCSSYFPRDHLVCEPCHNDEKKRSG